MLQGGTLPGAMKFDKNGAPEILDKPIMANYLQSKAGSAWLADEFSKRLGSKGVLSIVRGTDRGRMGEFQLANQNLEHTPWINEDRTPAKLGFLQEDGHGML